MQQRLDNPFVVGGPVRPEKFVGREELINRLVQRIKTRQNSAIVGAPRIGRTSIFKYLSTPENLARMRDSANPHEQVITILIDFQMFTLSTTPEEFWKYVSKRILNSLTEPNDRSTVQEFIKQDDFSPLSIATLFEDLALSNYRFVLFLDELDYIIGLKNLAVPDFLGALRSLTSVSEAYQMVVSTRRPLSELNVMTQSLNPNGSPYFNTLLEHQVGIFTAEESMTLLSWGDSAGFTAADKQLILRLAGQHPYRLQMAASILYDLKADAELSQEEMQLTLVERFTDMIDNYFSDVWERTLVERARIALAIMALEENDQLANEHEFAVSFKDLVKRYSSFMDILEDNGLIVRRADAPTISAQILTVWVLRKIASTAESRDSASFADWLYGQEIAVLGVTNNQRDWIVEKVQNMPKNWIPGLLGKLVTTFV
ncbi:MAG TPA: hypothetical protein VH186_19435 [Chloroflexia bacterium]|nr:hypothetical protein [Chloroflexia bacterium]